MTYLTKIGDILREAWKYIKEYIDNNINAIKSSIESWVNREFKKHRYSLVSVTSAVDTNKPYFELLHFTNPFISNYWNFSAYFLIEWTATAVGTRGAALVEVSMRATNDGTNPAISTPVFKYLTMSGTVTYLNTLVLGYSWNGKTPSSIEFGIYGKNSAQTYSSWKVTPISISIDDYGKTDWTNGYGLTFVSKLGTAAQIGLASVPYSSTVTISRESTSVSAADRASYRVDGAVAYCSTAAGTAAKVASCDNFQLKAGSQVFVRFTAANTASNATLNINNTGAKPLFVNGARATTSNLKAGTYLFTYDGTNWRCLVDKAPYQFDTSSGTLTVNY